ncbi:hypothetical protein ANN_03268 [Periplaneta americana]|uniref:Uncharacterized protein n=1 Tax=Periplaneta americana TaxID=6978 RepID=A0ABQ8TYI0_PERAM|nr:hypothetical protein ANN_03268 [Periplaneta americana]
MPSTWPRIEPATSGIEGQHYTNSANQVDKKKKKKKKKNDKPLEVPGGYNRKSFIGSPCFIYAAVIMVVPDPECQERTLFDRMRRLAFALQEPRATPTRALETLLCCVLVCFDVLLLAVICDERGKGSEGQVVTNFVGGGYTMTKEEKC